MIAGFDTEANNGSNNGVGICMIPKGVLGTYVGSYGETCSFFTYGYRNSSGEPFKFARPIYYGTDLYNLDTNIGYTLQKIIGTHLIKRNTSYPTWESRAPVIGSGQIFNKKASRVNEQRMVIPLNQFQLYGYQKLDTGFQYQYGYNNSILPIFKYISQSPPNKYNDLSITLPIPNIKYSNSIRTRYTTYTYQLFKSYFIADAMYDGSNHHVIIDRYGNPYSMNTYYSSLNTYNTNIGIYGTVFSNYGNNIDVTIRYRYFYGNSPGSLSMGTKYYYCTDFTNGYIGIRPTIYIR